RVDVKPIIIAIDQIPVIEHRERRRIAWRQAVRSPDPQVVIVFDFEGLYRRAIAPARGIDHELGVQSKTEPRSHGLVCSERHMRDRREVEIRPGCRLEPYFYLESGRAHPVPKVP